MALILTSAGSRPCFSHSTRSDSNKTGKPLGASFAREVPVGHTSGPALMNAYSNPHLTEALSGLQR